jgi:ferredoxin--NADP+ reductase
MRNRASQTRPLEESMSRPGTSEQPLRVAVIGSGPAGFYIAQQLFKAKDTVVEVDMFETLPTPFGLVRFGVAPDHPKIKSVSAVYEKQAANPNFRFFGDVEYGKDLLLTDLQDRYHQMVFCTGAPSDRRLGIPGEDLEGSHPATEFVAWYNGHPDYADRSYDLSCERAVVIGVGNVAVDVARILCRDPEELARTDIADPALEVLRKSRIREVLLVGRRGPAQAKFTNPEIKELGELSGTLTRVLPEEAELDDLSRQEVESTSDKATKRKLEIISALAQNPDADADRSLILRFLVSPEEILGDESGRVSGIRLGRNQLVARDGGGLAARSTGVTETHSCGLVFRSVGYRGLPLPDLPFRDDWGVLPNEAGRILDAEGTALRGLYTSGWIKRGPSGVIGTNKPDATETVEKMLEDLTLGHHAVPEQAHRESVDALLLERGVRPVRYTDWKKIDAAERSAGESADRPRVKLVTREALRDVLDD